MKKYVVYSSDSSSEKYERFIEFIFNHDQTDEEKLTLPSVVAISQNNVFYIQIEAGLDGFIFEGKLNAIIKALKKKNPRISLAKYKFNELLENPKARKTLFEIAWDIFRTAVLAA